MSRSRIDPELLAETEASANPTAETETSANHTAETETSLNHTAETEKSGNHTAAAEIRPNTPKPNAKGAGKTPVVASIILTPERRELYSKLFGGTADMTAWPDLIHLLLDPQTVVRIRPICLDAIADDSMVCHNNCGYDAANGKAGQRVPNMVSTRLLHEHACNGARKLKEEATALSEAFGEEDVCLRPAKSRCPKKGAHSHTWEEYCIFYFRLGLPARKGLGTTCPFPGCEVSDRYGI